jgi:hypothetical protein
MPDSQARLWAKACAGMPITALECKAIYVAGMLRHLVESAGLCLEERRHLPAYLLAMDAAELLGAVLSGRDVNSDEMATIALRYLANAPPDAQQDTVFEETPHGRYTIRDCLNRRHFTAHGGRKFPPGVVLDAALTVGLLCRLVAGLDRWWKELLENSGRRRLLANVDVVPLATGGSVVFVSELLDPLLDGATPGGALQHEATWRPHCR